MILKNRLKDPALLIRIGAACMLLANASLWFLRPADDFWRGFVDGAAGVLFGVSFGCLLYAARLISRRRSDSQDKQCAS